MNNFNERVERWVTKIETIPMVIATRFGPWLTLVIPAYFVQVAMVKHLSTPEWLGWTAAIALEVVGVAAIFNLLNMYQYNTQKRKIDPKAPILWASVATCVYYITAFLLVLVIEFLPSIARVAPAAFVILSGSSAGILALMYDQKQRVEAIKQVKEKRRGKKEGGSEFGGSAKIAEWLPIVPENRSEWRQLNLEQVIILPSGLTGRDLMECIPAVTSERVATGWLQDIDYQKNGKVKAE